MAKKSVIYRNLKREHKSQMARTKRQALKLIIKKNKNGSSEEQENALLKLQKSTRNESQCRVRRRCRACGRASGNLRKFGLCRIHLREAMMRGDVPGLRKASW